MFRKMTDLELMILEKEAVNCSDTEKLLGDYIDGELPPTLHSRVQDHIQSCEYCQEIDSGYRLTIQLAKELGQRKMPTDVRRRFRAGLNEKLGLSLSLAE